MSSVRFDVWVSKTSNARLTSAPELKCLPPTHEGFQQHVRRAHFQTMIWLSALGASPPKSDPTHHGWSYDRLNQRLIPITLPAGVNAAPDDILQLIRCSCSSALPCSTMRCSCTSASLSCSMFCVCQALDCQNHNTTLNNSDE